MHMEPRVLGQPLLDLRMLMRGVVVADQMKGLILRRFTIDLAQENEPLDMPMALLAARDDYGQNKIVEGAASKLTYIEVTNAQHFDAFIDNALLPGYDSMFIPLHYYFVKAMDAMYVQLTNNVPLPPAQVVRTIPRGGTPGSAPLITTANVPPISASPAAANQITFSGTTLTIPD